MVIERDKIAKQPVSSSKVPVSQIQLVKQEFSRARSYASEYQDNTPIAHFFNTRLRRVSELLGQFKSGRVLDIGCGPAIIGNTFRGRPVEYYGVDISEDMIKECTHAFGADPQFHFSLGKIEELPFPDSYFDVVLCLGVLEYVMDGHAAMSESGRVLKPEGILIATMLNKRSPYRIWQSHGYWKFQNGIKKLSRLIRPMSDRPQGSMKNGDKRKRPEIKLYSERAFRRLITASGVEVEDVLYYDFNLFFSPLDIRFPRGSVWLSRRLELLCKSRLKCLGTGFMLKCRKR